MATSTISPPPSSSSSSSSSISTSTSSPAKVVSSFVKQLPTVEFSNYLHRQVDVDNIPLRVATSNLGCGPYEPVLKMNRLQKHIADWKDVNPDILGLQEVRRYPESITKGTPDCIQPEDIYYHLGKMGYDVAVGQCDDIRSGYSNWIAYKRNKLLLALQNTYWLGTKGSFTTVSGGLHTKGSEEFRSFSACANVVIFNHLIDDDNKDSQSINQEHHLKLIHDKKTERLPRLIVINVHLPTEFNIKRQCVYSVHRLVQYVTEDFDVPFILLGDFNSFPQDPTPITGIFTSPKSLSDVTALIGKDGQKINGTWSGYPSMDPFFANNANPPVIYPTGMIHHLDHLIYDSKFITLLATLPEHLKTPHGVVYTDEERVRTESGPSDHHLLYAVFDISIGYLKNPPSSTSKQEIDVTPNIPSAIAILQTAMKTHENPAEFTKTSMLDIASDSKFPDKIKVQFLLSLYEIFEEQCGNTELKTKIMKDAPTWHGYKLTAFALIVTISSIKRRTAIIEALLKGDRVLVKHEYQLGIEWLYNNISSVTPPDPNSSSSSSSTTTAATSTPTA